MSKSNYLGDATLVNQLVREFMAGVFSARAEFLKTGDGETGEGRVNHLARQYGAIFLGQSAAYKPQPWNSRYRLGAYLRAAVPAEVGTFDSPGEAYFHFLAVQAINAALAAEDGSVPESEIQSSLTEVIEDAVDVLLGRKIAEGAYL